MRRRRTYGMTFFDRQAVTVNIERQTYREALELCRRERQTFSELINTFLTSKLEGTKDSSSSLTNSNVS